MGKTKNKCYNCIHAGDKFKIDGKTHLHCYHPSYLGFEDVSPWETLRVFWDSCNDFKEKEVQP